MIYLDLEDLLRVAARVIMERCRYATSGCLSRLLTVPAPRCSGLMRIRRSMSKAAALLHSVVSNHALVDGNKRLAWVP